MIDPNTWSKLIVVIAKAKIGTNDRLHNCSHKISVLIGLRDNFDFKMYLEPYYKTFVP